MTLHKGLHWKDETEKTDIWKEMELKNTAKWGGGELWETKE